MKNEQEIERVLGRVLSKEELTEVSGGSTSPCTDGCVDEMGQEVPCC